jgi:glucose dehydrogenase
MVIKGRVVAGMSGCYHLNSRCWVSAHDVETGEEAWRTYTIPGRGEFGYDSWGDIPDEDRRGGSAWNAPSYDPELNLIFTGVGVPIPWGSVQRGTGDGDVLYTNSTLALNADTGEIVWYFQHIPNDEWDLDHPFARLVLETDDARRFRAFDARSGDVLWEQILNSSAGGFPVAYMHDGVQYIAIAAGGGINFRGLTPEIQQPGRGNTLFVFRLP